MSSNTYSACLTPDPWLRLVVLISGRLLIAASLVLVLTLPLAAVGRFELQRLRRGQRYCQAIRIFSDGGVEILDPAGDWVPGRLLSGSLVLQTIGWLRLTTDDGMSLVETVRGDARECEQWRRLQVIWRHIGAER